MHKYNSKTDHRRSIRLKGYDYSQAGLYFITICIEKMECLFGEICRDNPCGCPELILNNAGKMIEMEWLKLPKRFKNIQSHGYVIMPNHFHSILEIVGASLVVARNNNETINNSKNNGSTNKMGINNYSANETDVRNDCIDDKNGQPFRTQYNGPPHNWQPHNGQPQGIAPTDKTVGDMIGAFQSITTNEYIHGVKQNNWKRFDGKLWQRNYWEHIIRDEKSYNNISEYIKNNPLNWNNDKLNNKNINMVSEDHCEYNHESWMV